MAVHSSILAWRVPWTEEAGGLQSMGSPKGRMRLKRRRTHAALLLCPSCRCRARGGPEGLPSVTAAALSVASSVNTRADASSRQA